MRVSLDIDFVPRMATAAELLDENGPLTSDGLVRRMQELAAEFTELGCDVELTVQSGTSRGDRW